MLTRHVLGHKTAMTLVYIAGVALGFLLNKAWSFEHRGGMGGPLVRYVATYLLGYLINVALLIGLVDTLHLPHEVVQGLIIFGLPLFFFLMQKFWVFRRVAAERGMR